MESDETKQLIKDSFKLLAACVLIGWIIFNAQMNKVYTGDKPFEEHLKELENLYGKSNWKTHAERKLETVTEKPKQSLEVRRLKLEAGLVK